MNDHDHTEHTHDDHDETDIGFDVPPHIIEAATAIVLNPDELAKKDVYVAAAAMLTSIFEAYT